MLFLAKPIPGVSTIMGRKFSILDFAEIFEKDGKSGVERVRLWITIYNQMRRLSQSFAENNGLILAER